MLSILSFSETLRRIYICSTILKQLAFMVARQLFTFELPENVQIRDEIMSIISNSHLSAYFQGFAREVGGFYLNMVYFYIPYKARHNGTENTRRCLQELARTNTESFACSGRDCGQCSSKSRFIFRKWFC